MRDPYEVLGLDRKASAGEIKNAYRRLAKKLHPDANKNDPKAATRFSELNAAHELLQAATSHLGVNFIPEEGSCQQCREAV